MAPLPEIAKNSQKITFREFNPIIIIKLLLMIVKNQKPPFWCQNLTSWRQLPVFNVNVMSQTKKWHNFRNNFRRKLVDPSLWVGLSFMNNFIQNYSPSVWKYTENKHYDVMWRHMTSHVPIFKKSWAIIFWTMMITETKFGVNWINRKEMVNECQTFFTFSGNFPRVWCSDAFWAKNHHLCGFYD